MKNTKVKKATEEKGEKADECRWLNRRKTSSSRRAEPKRAEKTRMAAPKCATQKKFRHLSRTKSIDVLLFTEQKTVEQQTVDLTTFRPEVSSG